LIGQLQEDSGGGASVAAIVLVAASGLVTAGMLLLIVFGGRLGEASPSRRSSATPSPGSGTSCAGRSHSSPSLLFGLIYYLAPNQEPRSWKWITPGSLVGSRYV